MNGSKLRHATADVLVRHNDGPSYCRSCAVRICAVVILASGACRRKSPRPSRNLDRLLRYRSGPARCTLRNSRQPLSSGGDFCWVVLHSELRSVCRRNRLTLNRSTNHWPVAEVAHFGVICCVVKSLNVGRSKSHPSSGLRTAPFAVSAGEKIASDCQED